MNKFFLDFLFTSVAIIYISYSSRETERKNSMYFKSYVQNLKTCRGPRIFEVPRVTFYKG